MEPHDYVYYVLTALDLWNVQKRPRKERSDNLKGTSHLRPQKE